MADLSLSARLALLGYTHSRTPNAHNTGKHFIHAPDGALVGEFTAHEAWDLLNGLVAAEAARFAGAA